MLTIQGIHVYIYIYIHIDIRKLTSDTTKQNGVGLRVGIKNDILSFTVTSKSSVFRSYDRFLPEAVRGVVEKNGRAHVPMEYAPRA